MDGAATGGERYYYGLKEVNTSGGEKDSDGLKEVRKDKIISTIE